MRTRYTPGCWSMRSEPVGPQQNGRARRPCPVARAPARHPRRHQGHYRRPGASHGGGLAAVRTSGSPGRRAAGRCPASGRRDHPGQDGHGRVLLFRSLANTQSLEPGAHAGRFQQRLGRGLGHGHVPGSLGHTDRRVARPAVDLLRSGTASRPSASSAPRASCR